MISGQGRTVLPLWHYSDFYLMKIVNHVASRVSAPYIEFSMTWGQKYTSFQLVYRIYFVFPSFLAPPDWLTLITLLVSFFLPIFNILPFAMLSSYPMKSVKYSLEFLLVFLSRFTRLEVDPVRMLISPLSRSHL